MQFMEFMESTVAEIHRYPERPSGTGFMEPLFATPESKREVMEHFLLAPWLFRASEIVAEPAGQYTDGPQALAGYPPSGARTAHRCDEPVDLRRGLRDGQIEVIRRGDSLRGSLRGSPRVPLDVTGVGEG